MQGRTHLGFHGADRAAPQLGDLLVGEVAILAEQKDGLFLGRKALSAWRRRSIFSLFSRADAGEASGQGQGSGGSPSGLIRRRQVLA